MEAEIKSFNDIPEGMTPIITSKTPNKELLLDEGEFHVKWKKKEFKVTGRIIFSWIPSVSVKFRGEFSSDNDKISFEEFISDLEIEVVSENLNFSCNGLIQMINISGQNHTISGILNPPIYLGNQRTDVNIVRFEVPNLLKLSGLPIRRQKSVYKGRLLLEDKDYRIILDNTSFKLKKISNLKTNGGYLLQYTGSIERINNKNINIKSIQDLLENFTCFLYFINGRRTSPLILHGYIDDEIIWKDYTPYIIDSYKYVITWPSKNSIEGISQLWSNFRILWKDRINVDCLKSILHWYVEANSNAAYVEGSIILIQTALELLFHWIISESLSYVTSNDADNLSAATKISFLLATFNISPDIPNELCGLVKYSQEFNILNGPEAFVRIRNCIVHPSKKKRQTLKGVSKDAKYEALHLGIWYVERILLKHMKFKGKYENRCKTITSGFESDELFE